MDNFFEKVWEVACQIPVGRVTSYGAIGRYLGATRSARMVGWAMSNSRASKVNVESEGVRVEDNQVVDFEVVFWDPVKELGIH